MNGQDITYSQLNNLIAHSQAFITVMLTGPCLLYAKHDPAGRRNFLSILFPLLLQFYSGVQTITHTKWTCAPIWKHLCKRLVFSSQISSNRTKAEHLKTVSQQSWPNQLKSSVTVQTILKVWFCLETVQESIATRDSLRHEPHSSCRNTSLRLQTDLVDSPGKKQKVPKVCVSANMWWLSWIYTELQMPLFLVLLRMVPHNAHHYHTHTAPYSKRTTHKTQVLQTASPLHYPLSTKI